MSTYFPSGDGLAENRKWYVVDAAGQTVGRLATEVARVLTGKNKPQYTPFLDTGDHVIVVNADKVVLTKGKADTQMVYRYSGYPGGLRSETYGNLLGRKPADAIRLSVRGMIPKGPLGRQQIKKLKVYADAEGATRHAAQRPEPLALSPKAAAQKA